MVREAKGKGKKVAKSKGIGFPARSDQPRQVKDYTSSSSYKKLQGKYNKECDMISIFFQTPSDQERVKPRPKTISRADLKPKHAKLTWSTSLSREKSYFIRITLLYDF
ncbi:hypothetical protein V6N12_010409 [Hibiscus sabdariffa]|uniref:Uncharacterized protein n=1 Tax=Hibiscus sabdariffa TaxID=183260 RepID=A0ABR2EKE1_9ROSI